MTGFFFQRRRLLRQERRVVTRPRREHASIEFNDARGQSREQRTIVGHEEDAAAQVEELLLEPLNHLDV